VSSTAWHEAPRWRFSYRALGRVDPERALLVERHGRGWRLVVATVELRDVAQKRSQFLVAHFVLVGRFVVDRSTLRLLGGLLLALV
jgi:hypothetical protein